MGRGLGLPVMTRKNPADTLEEEEAMERRHDGPWTQRDLDLYRAELKRAQERREQLWEWHDTEKKARQVYVEPAGVWMTIE